MKISPKYMINLISKIEDTLWGLSIISKYQTVENYLKRWQEEEYDSYGNIAWENFHIVHQEGSKNIALRETLHGIKDDGLLIRIANDLGIETPGFLPLVPEKFKNVLVNNNENSKKAFERAISLTYEKPDEAIVLASSALDGIIKTILNDEHFSEKKIEGNKSLTKQASAIIRIFKEDFSDSFPEEIKAIAGNLNGLASSIDNLRSRRTLAHGHSDNEEIVADSYFAMLAVNSVATLGLFLWSYYNENYPIQNRNGTLADQDDEELDEIPF